MVHNNEVEAWVATFYKFVDLENLTDLQLRFRTEGSRLALKGTILIAPEGINATISGTKPEVQQFMDFLRSFPEFSDLTSRETQADRIPFLRLKVKIKKETIALKSKVRPIEKTGIRVAPKDWNELLSNPNLVLIDARNDYEIEQGAFRGAINPEIKTFSEFRNYAENRLNPAHHKKIAMYCTGGIRCEKASSLLLELGFEEVFQLDGGIIRYQMEVPTEQSLFEGKNYVFDERISV